MHYREYVLTMKIIERKEEKGEEIIYNFVHCLSAFRTAPDNESDIERIPCEYCDALISVDDWKPHSVSNRYLVRPIYFN